MATFSGDVQYTQNGTVTNPWIILWMVEKSGKNGRVTIGTPVKHCGNNIEQWDYFLIMEETLYKLVIRISQQCTGCWASKTTGEKNIHSFWMVHHHFMYHLMYHLSPIFYVFFIIQQYWWLNPLSFIYIYIYASGGFSVRPECFVLPEKCYNPIVHGSWDGDGISTWVFMEIYGIYGISMFSHKKWWEIPENHPPWFRRFFGGCLILWRGESIDYNNV